MRVPRQDVFSMGHDARVLGSGADGMYAPNDLFSATLRGEHALPRVSSLVGW